MTQYLANHAASPRALSMWAAVNVVPCHANYGAGIAVGMRGLRTMTVSRFKRPAIKAPSQQVS